MGNTDGQVCQSLFASACCFYVKKAAAAIVLLSFLQESDTRRFDIPLPYWHDNTPKMYCIHHEYLSKKFKNTADWEHIVLPLGTHIICVFIGRMVEFLHVCLAASRTDLADSKLVFTFHHNAIIASCRFQTYLEPNLGESVLTGPHRVLDLCRGMLVVTNEILLL